MAKKSIGSLFASLSLDSSGLTKGLRKAKRSLNKFSRESGKLGQAITKNFTLPLAAVSAAALKLDTDLNKSLGNIQSLLGANSEAFKRVKDLKNDIQSLSIGLGTSTSDLASATYEIISAFGDSAETARLLEISAKAAKAGVASTTDAVSLLSAVSKGYNDTSAETIQKISDLSFMTVKLGQTGFGSLASGIKGAIPLSKELGLSLEEVFASQATFTGVLGESAEVSTKLQGVLKALLAPNENMNKLFNKFNVKTGKDFIERAGGLQEAVKLITDEAKSAGIPLQKFIGSIEGVQFALALSGAQFDSYREKLSQMKTASGATSEAFQAQTEGIGKMSSEMDKLGSRLTVAGQLLGESLAPFLERINELLKPLAEKISKLAESFKSLNSETKGLIINTALIVASLGGVLLVLSSISKAVPIVLSGMATGVGALLSPIGLLVAGLGSVYLVFGSFEKAFLNFETGLKILIVKAKSMFKTLVTFVTQEVIDPILSKIQGLILRLPAKIRPEGIFNSLSDIRRYLKPDPNQGPSDKAQIEAITSDQQRRLGYIDKRNKKKKGLFDLPDYSKAVDKANEVINGQKQLEDQTGNTNAELEKQKKKLEDLLNSQGQGTEENKKDQKNALDELEDSTKHTFNDELKGSISAWGEHFKYTLSGMVREGKFSFATLRDSFLDNITNTIINSGIDSILGGLLPGLFGKSSGGGLGGLFSGFFANGGTMRANSFGVVGERGAELVYSGNQPLNVMNASKTSALFNSIGSGSGQAPIVVNQTLNFGEGVNHQARQAILNSKGEIQKWSLEAVQNAKARGKF